MCNSTLPAGTAAGDVEKATLLFWVNKVDAAGAVKVLPVTSTGSELGVIYNTQPGVGGPLPPVPVPAVNQTFPDVVPPQPSRNERSFAMNVYRRICLVAALAFAPSLNAQVCSGGADGGMDATGNQCNTPGDIGAYPGRSSDAPATTARVAQANAEAAGVRPFSHAQSSPAQASRFARPVSTALQVGAVIQRAADERRNP